MKLCATMRKFPGGMMVIPLVIGCLVNTFIPQVLQIGGFTTALFKGGQATLVGLFIFCSGATISFKEVGLPLYKGIILTVLKFAFGFAVGALLNMFFGPAGILGLTPFAVIGALTNSNGAIYTALAKEFGDETDMGAIAVLSLNDGPFLTMIAMGASGLADIPVIDIVAAIVPLIVGMILGNLDGEFRTLLSNGLNMVLRLRCQHEPVHHHQRRCSRSDHGPAVCLLHRCLCLLGLQHHPQEARSHGYGCWYRRRQRSSHTGGCRHG